MDWEIENYWDFLWILVLISIAFLWIKLIIWRKKTRLLFAEEKFHNRLFNTQKSFPKLFAFGYCLAFILLILASVGIHQKQKKGIIYANPTSNTIFLIDISNSMNAEDIGTSRLEQSKNIVSQTLKHLNNDKVGIVVFAGDAQSLMPLTDDYPAVDILINQLDTDIIKQQGSDFLVAIKEGAKRMNHIPIGMKKIILISDGEDNEGQHHLAIEEAKKQNIIITSVGIGTKKGSPIPEKKFNYYNDYKRDNWGNVVISKRETQALKELSQATGGQYIDGNNTQNAVNEIIKEIHSLDKTNTNQEINIIYIEHFYQYFLGIAILIFFLIFLLNPKKDFNF